MGDVRDFRNFMGAVIDRKAFEKHQRATSSDARRNATHRRRRRRDDEKGYFIEPTLVETARPGLPPDVRGDLRPGGDASTSTTTREWNETLELVRRDLALRAHRRRLRAAIARAVREAATALRNAAGNFYVNDKPTGAVVGQQPFGGARASGTNDKAGSKLNLVRWVSARAIKETFVPPRDYRYPFMAEE